MKTILKHHLLISIGLLFSAIAYAANPVSVSCENCSSGWDKECTASHYNGPQHHWLWSGQPVGYGSWDGGGENGRDLVLFGCESGSTTGVTIKGTAHDGSHSANGHDTDTFVCN